MNELLKNHGLFLKKSPNSSVGYVHRLKGGEKVMTLHPEKYVRCNTPKEVLNYVLTTIKRNEPKK